MGKAKKKDKKTEKKKKIKKKNKEKCKLTVKGGTFDEKNVKENNVCFCQQSLLFLLFSLLIESSSFLACWGLPVLVLFALIAIYIKHGDLKQHE